MSETEGREKTVTPYYPVNSLSLPSLDAAIANVQYNPSIKCCEIVVCVCLLSLVFEGAGVEGHMRFSAI